MSKTIAHTRQIAARSIEAARLSIVVICGSALVAAGQALPF
ncbi:hypothetical protein [Alteraurantiacibacter aestuarii]|nr:hypothetical protein [Alteraurantiacibacter aestuarii]